MEKNFDIFISEVENKLAEYHLPTISAAYEKDLITSREYVEKLIKFEEI